MQVADLTAPTRKNQPDPYWLTHTRPILHMPGKSPYRTCEIADRHMSGFGVNRDLGDVSGQTGQSWLSTTLRYAAPQLADLRAVGPWESEFHDWFEKRITLAVW